MPNIIETIRKNNISIESSKSTLEKGDEILLRSQLIRFKKEFTIENMVVSNDRIIYQFASERIADSCIAMAEKIIERKALNLEVFRPKLSKNLVVREKRNHE